MIMALLFWKIKHNEWKMYGGVSVFLIFVSFYFGFHILLVANVKENGYDT